MINIKNLIILVKVIILLKVYEQKNDYLVLLFVYFIFLKKSEHNHDVFVKKREEVGEINLVVVNELVSLLLEVSMVVVFAKA